MNGVYYLNTSLNVKFAMMMITTVANLCVDQGILKRESGLFLTPVLTLWGGGHITRTYGGELLYLGICGDHSARSAQIIITA